MIKKSYAIYNRSPVGLQRESSPSAQRIEQCKAIVSAVGGSLVGVFEDIGVSGSRGATASARDQLMERVKAGGIDYVVVPDLARLSRIADRPRSGARMTAQNLDYELWRRVEDRRDATLNPDLPPEEQKLLSLALSLARLAARRDSATGTPS